MIPWFSKKWNSVTLSIAKAKYIVVESCYVQILWIKQQPKDYCLKYNKIFIRYDNTSIIYLTKNLNQHFRTRHTKIRYILLEIIFLKMILCLNLFLLIIYFLISLLNSCMKKYFAWLAKDLVHVMFLIDKCILCFEWWLTCYIT